MFPSRSIRLRGSIISRRNGGTFVEQTNWIRKTDRKGRSYTFKRGYACIKGWGGLLGFNYRNVCEARYSHTPLRSTTLRGDARSLAAATFPFLHERTGALASAVNCAPVIRGKAVVLSAPGPRWMLATSFGNRSRLTQTRLSIFDGNLEGP